MKNICKPTINNEIIILSLEQLKNEIQNFIVELTTCHYSVKECMFKLYRKSIYNAIYTHTKFLDKFNTTFKGRLFCILNNIVDIPCCPTCGKELDPSNWRRNANCLHYCSRKCNSGSLERKVANKLRRENMTQEEKDARFRKQSEIQKKFFSIPGNKEKRLAKIRATKLLKHGNEKYVNVVKMKQTFKDRYGDEKYRNIEKQKITNSQKSSEQKQIEINKRLETLNKHKAEDLDFVSKIVAKSIETRKKNNGEDYTGRNKCKKTFQVRYGVDNPMQLDNVKKKIEETDFIKYGVKHHIAAAEIRNKAKIAYQEKYGVDNPFAAKEVINAIHKDNIEKYGVAHNWQREDIKEKIKQTNLERYGVEHVAQNSEIRAKSQMNINYDNISFDSYPELCLYIWVKDNKIEFEYQPNISFEYTYAGVKHYYCPDFKIAGKLYEIKGDHFFKSKNPANEMVCPWDHSKNGLYEAKHQCMIENNIQILTSVDYNKYISYVESKFGKDFYSNLKEEKNTRYNLKHS